MYAVYLLKYFLHGSLHTVAVKTFCLDAFLPKYCIFVKNLDCAKIYCTIPHNIHCLCLKITADSDGSGPSPLSQIVYWGFFKISICFYNFHKFQVLFFGVF